MRYRLICGAAVVACAISMGPARAAIMVGTYTGTADVVANDLTAFGQVGAFNASFTATFIFDTTLGAIHDTSGETYHDGGGPFSITNPDISSTLTINGVTQSFSASLIGEVRRSADGRITNDAISTVIGKQNSLIADIYTATPHLSLIESFTAPSIAHSGTGSLFSLLAANSVSRAKGTLNITSVTFAPLDAVGVPEPKSWALMLGGFGIAGAALRRRRRAFAT